MPFPLALVGITSVLGGHAARIGITNAGIRSFSGQFVQSLPFGAGYSLGTYLGFPKNFQSKSTNSRGSSFIVNTMPYTRYGRYYRRSYNRYSRFGSRRRRYRRSYRTYRRYY